MHWAANKVWQSMACALRDADGHRRYDALHRPAAWWPSGGDRRTGSVGHRPGRGSAAHHCIHHPGCFHLFERPACSGLHRHREGHPHLCDGFRSNYCDPHTAWRVRANLLRRTAGQAAIVTPIYPLTIGGFSMPGYTAFYTLLLNLVVAVMLTPVPKLQSSTRSADQTLPADYYA